LHPKADIFGFGIEVSYVPMLSIKALRVAPNSDSVC
jgi:hypothetical protein